MDRFTACFNTKVGDDNTATNEDVYRHPAIGVSNAINDVYDGRDVVVLGYGVSGSGEIVHPAGRAVSVRAIKTALRRCFWTTLPKRTKTWKRSTPSPCAVKELYGTTPSLHPDIGSALMSGSIYEFAPTEMIREIPLSNSTTSTKIEYETEEDRERKAKPEAHDPCGHVIHYRYCASFVQRRPNLGLCGCQQPPIDRRHHDPRCTWRQRGRLGLQPRPV